MKINSVLVLVGTASTDTIYIHTDLPKGIWPFKGGQVFQTEVSRGSGIEYAKKNFPDVEVKVRTAT